MNWGFLIGALLFFFIAVGVLVYVIMTNNKKKVSKPEEIVQDKIYPDREIGIFQSFSDEGFFKSHKFFKILNRRFADDLVTFTLKPFDNNPNDMREYPPEIVTVKKSTIIDLGKSYSGFRNVVFHYPAKINDLNEEIKSQTPIGILAMKHINQNNSNETWIYNLQKQNQTMKDLFDELIRGSTDNVLMEKYRQMKDAMGDNKVINQVQP